MTVADRGDVDAVDVSNADGLEEVLRAFKENDPSTERYNTVDID